MKRYDFKKEFEGVGVMRILLDHELLTLKEAQRLLQVNRCEINTMIKSGRLKTITVGNQCKIEGWSLKSMMIGKFPADDFDRCSDQQFFVNASDSELLMISEWT